MKYDQKWSYPIGRIEEYVVSKGGIRSDCVYLLENCTVRLEDLPPKRLGLLVLPVTRVIIEGEGADDFYHGFYLNFLSGGA